MNSQYCPIIYLGEQKHLKKEEVQNRPFPINKTMLLQIYTGGNTRKTPPKPGTVSVSLKEMN